MRTAFVILLSGIFSLTLGSCYKTPRLQCETWEYYDECTPKSSIMQVCNREPNTTALFCLDDMKGLAPGVTRTLFENADKVVVRHFVSKR